MNLYRRIYYLMIQLLGNEPKGFGVLKGLCVQIHKELNDIPLEQIVPEFMPDFIGIKARIGHYATAPSFFQHVLHNEVKIFLLALDRIETKYGATVGPQHMKIAVTWSKDFSHQIALYLKEWIPNIFPEIDPWVSSEDIQVGKRWFDELMAYFTSTTYSIVCITAENALSPWVYYEVGIVAGQEAGITSAYLIGAKRENLNGTPLNQFQNAYADKNGTLKLLISINTELKDKGYKKDELEERFNQHWPKLQKKIASIVEEMGELEQEIEEVTGTEEPELKDSSKKLLILASKDNRGMIAFVETRGGVSITTSGVELVKEQNPREQAQWKGAIKELEDYGYLENKGGKGMVFEVTDEGHIRAERLIAEDTLLELSEAARTLLAKATAAQRQTINMSNTFHGFTLSFSNDSFIDTLDKREEQKWRDACGELESVGLLESPNGSRDYFVVTTPGFEAADWLRIILPERA